MQLDVIIYDDNYEEKYVQPHSLRIITLIIVIGIIVFGSVYLNFWLSLFLALIFYCIIDYLYRLYKGE